MLLKLIWNEAGALMRSWPALLLAFVASTIYVLSEVVVGFAGWAASGRLAGSWAAIWYYIAFFPAILSLGWFRNPVQRELVWTRSAPTWMLLAARYAAATAAALIVWSAAVFAGFVAIMGVHAPSLERVLNLPLMASLGLPHALFYVAMLLFLSAVVTHRATAYGLAIFYFLSVLFTVSPGNRAYLHPAYLPPGHMVSEYVLLGGFETVVGAKSLLAVLLAAAFLLAAIYAVSRRRRPVEHLALAGAVLCLALAFFPVRALVAAPSPPVWLEGSESVAGLKADAMGKAAMVARGDVPAEAFGYRVEAQLGGVRTLLFARPSACVEAFVPAFAQTFRLLERAHVLATVVETPFVDRVHFSPKESIAFLPERYRWRRDRAWCMRVAIREAVGALWPPPQGGTSSLRGLLRERGSQDAMRALRARERQFAEYLIAQWYAVHRLLGAERLEREMVLWRDVASSGRMPEELHHTGAVAQQVAVPGRGLWLAFEMWEELGPEGVPEMFRGRAPAEGGS